MRTVILVPPENKQITKIHSLSRRLGTLKHIGWKNINNCFRFVDLQFDENKSYRLMRSVFTPQWFVVEADHKLSSREISLIKHLIRKQEEVSLPGVKVWSPYEHTVEHYMPNQGEDIPTKPGLYMAQTTAFANHGTVPEILYHVWE